MKVCEFVELSTRASAERMIYPAMTHMYLCYDPICCPAETDVVVHGSSIQKYDPDIIQANFILDL